MKRKIIFGSIFTAFLMVSIAFIQPVNAGGREPVDIIENPEKDMQNVGALVEIISNNKQVLNYIETLLQDRQINFLLRQIQVVNNLDEINLLLLEFETLLTDMDLVSELGNILTQRYITEITLIEGLLHDDNIDWSVIELPNWILVILLIWLILVLLWEKWFAPPFPP